MTSFQRTGLFLLGGLTLSTLTLAQDARAVKKDYLKKPEETEFWDPEVRVVTPAPYGQPPSDAKMLFNGKNMDGWVSVKDGSPAKWTVADGAFTVAPGTGNISTKEDFGSYQLHIEWRSPNEPDTKKSQGKGNSGIFMQGMYEVQVLNSYQNRSYRNGQAGSIYKQSAPLVNATSKMGDWNTYDILYTAPKFRENGTYETPPYVTVIHNGVVVQNHTPIQGTTEYIGTPKVLPHGKGPISLQDHGNLVSFRNIWIREL